MINNFVKAWDENKNKLEEYFKSHKMEEYDNYTALVKLLFDVVINPYLRNNNLDYFDTNFLTTIDDGDYQGSQIFLIPEYHYQPSPYNYVFTHCEYGSCSGCDLLLSIQLYDTDKLPDDEQIRDHMTLCLHLLQRCKYLCDKEEYLNEV